MHPTNTERFWSKTKRNEETGCLDWLSNKDKDGYGLFKIKIDDKWTNGRVHRLVWSLNFGEIPARHSVCHKCDRASCCEISHLFIGTTAENNNDMIQKGRSPCIAKIGTQNTRAKLDETAVKDIRERFESGAYSKAALGRFYGVSVTAIRYIVIGKLWQHI